MIIWSRSSTVSESIRVLLPLFQKVYKSYYHCSRGYSYKGFQGYIYKCYYHFPLFHGYIYNTVPGGICNNTYVHFHACLVMQHHVFMTKAVPVE